MNRFIRTTALFALIVAAILAACELAVRNVATPYSYKGDFMRSNGDKVATLVLGNSHTYYGIRPDLLADSAFNLANSSQTPQYDLAILRNFHKFAPNLRRVILQIGYSSFREQELEDAEPGRCVSYKIGMKLPVHSDFSIYNFAITDFRAFAGRIRGFFVEQDVNRCDSLGFGLGFDKSSRSPDWEQKSRERVEFLTSPYSERVAANTASFDALIRYCKQAGIECILLTTPTWHTFRDNIDRNQYGEMRRIADSLAAANKIRYINLFDSPLFTSDDFHDCDHLSDIGAVRLSRMLRDSIDSRR